MVGEVTPGLMVCDRGVCLVVVVCVRLAGCWEKE